MPRKESKEVRAKKYAEVLKISYEEALKVVEDDDIIDAGGRCDWETEPTAEEKKVMRKARMADRTVSAEKAKRTRAEDTDKRELMGALESLARDMGEDVIVTNVEREIELTYNGRKFKITLSAPRGSKKAD
jgi:hypothetical protein